jgi:streptogramin lyase
LTIAHSPFSGGGLTIPWGIVIDGNDTVWVANFSFPFDLANPENTPPPDELNRVSHFCGVDTAGGPSTKQTVGQAIPRMAPATRARRSFAIPASRSIRRATYGWPTTGRMCRWSTIRAATRSQS